MNPFLYCHCDVDITTIPKEQLLPYILNRPCLWKHYSLVENKDKENVFREYLESILYIRDLFECPCFIPSIRYFDTKTFFCLMSETRVWRKIFNCAISYYSEIELLEIAAKSSTFYDFYMSSEYILV